jgi:hypothetical protein
MFVGDYDRGPARPPCFELIMLDIVSAIQEMILFIKEIGIAAIWL